MASNYSNNPALYLLNGNNIKTTFGAWIEQSTGFWDIPKPKENVSFSWPDENGLDVNLTARYFEALTPELTVMFSHVSYLTLKSNIRAFMAEWQKTGLQYLKLANDPRLYLVFYTDIGIVERLTKLNASKHFARLRLKLCDPNPLIRQFMADKTIAGSVSLVITSSKPVTIDWGDGSFSSLAGNGTVNHNYLSGIYCITVYPGEGITSVISTGCSAL